MQDNLIGSILGTVLTVPFFLISSREVRRMARYRSRSRHRHDFSLPIIAGIFIVAFISACGEKILLTKNSEPVTPKNIIETVSEVVTDGSWCPGETEFCDLSGVPAYSGSPYFVLNNDSPFFAEDQLVIGELETYGELDPLGRCTSCIACVSLDTVPAQGEQRGEIESVTPSGWNQAFYYCIDDGDDETGDENPLYNRSHLIAWCLTAQNANPNNLITATRYANADCMWIQESLVQDYIYRTGGHVLYRVTPVYHNNNLVASGILMEGWSLEDRGASVRFCRYIYNVQPEIEINYMTGSSRYTGITSGAETPAA